MLVSTAHLSHQRGSHELKTGESSRVGETKRIIAALKRLAKRREPVFFMGDFNDPAGAPTLLHEAGYPSCFAVLGLQPDPTFKCYPTARVAPGKLAMSQTVDWIVANREARPIAASIPRFTSKTRRRRITGRCRQFMKCSALDVESSAFRWQIRSFC